MLSGDCNVRCLAKAPPDECFYGIGNPSNCYSFGQAGLTQAEIDSCVAGGGRPKVNQGYVWGLARCGSNLWFGTAANVPLLVNSTYLGSTNIDGNSWFVAEYGESAFCDPPYSLSPALGDWRPPHILVYDTEHDMLTGKDADLSAAASSLLRNTLGLRSAGTSERNDVNPNRVAILGGPALPETGGINLFAFDGDTGVFLAATNLPAYNNIRKWLNVNGVLYTGVGNTAGGGSVLRWVDDPAHPQYPFAFEVVGDIDNAPSELAFHEGRLFVDTWPCEGAYPGEGLDWEDMLAILDRPAALWMSPVIPAGGLTPANGSGWVIVWRVTDYEPDIVIASTYGGGAMASYKGYLYWGTMHVPSMSELASTLAYEYVNGFPPEDDDADELSANSQRAIGVFRGRNFRPPVEVAGPIPGSPITIRPGGDFELLYGESYLPKFDHLTGTGWSAIRNKMRQEPLYGPSGFGNPKNNYTWTMMEYKGELYVGTMDSSVLSVSRSDRARIATLGADLFRFPSASARAVPVSRTGVSNYSSYGVRTMVKDDEFLYLGMANPMNLLTDPDDNFPEGGWELLELSHIHRPTLRWDAVPGATWYQIWLNRNRKKTAAPWVRQETTSWSPEFSLASGSYDCWVRSWGETMGYGPWTVLPSFSVPERRVGAPELVLPSGIQRDQIPTYVWEQVDYATWYQLWVGRGSKVVLNRWIERDFTHETPADAELAYGQYAFYVRAWNADGMGPWSTGVVFTIGQIAAADFVSPAGNVAVSPTEYRWRDRYPDAASYQIWVGNAAGAKVWARTVTASETGVAAGASRTSAGRRFYDGDAIPLLSPGSYNWWLQLERDGSAGPWSGPKSFTVLPPP